ncbi:GFA family protein [Arenibaculum pallidiluteum]|uniref:GFA family protein n=1 Tax=Arenibaculum pallidiluteum TaxID=2812559 RepID=UPI001A97C076|nr:GFA family protein [Arenibaculum pallidiluteum]
MAEATQETVHETHEGGCLCGAVRYRVSGIPVSANACFCTMCRRQTGSALPAFATWNRAQFVLLAGEPAAYAASPKAERQFCPRCGSALFWIKNGGEEVDVFLGSLDAPERIRPPDYAIWTRHRLPWVPPLGGPEFTQSRG